MKKLLFLLFFYAPTLYGQTYAPACADTLYEEEDKFCFECGEHQFFGGAYQFKRFLKINLNQKIRKGEITSGEVVLLVHIDTLGQTQNVAFLAKMDACESCNQTILDMMKKIKRWQPNCHYAFQENRIICEENDLKITIKIKDRQIFLLTTE